MNFRIVFFIVIYSTLIFTHKLKAQKDSIGFFSPTKDLNKKRIFSVVSSECLLYAGVSVGLNSLWYKDYERTSFHFFNDNAEWLQMDKVGHIVTSYYVGRAGMAVMKWSGLEKKKAIWYGGTLGSMFLTTVEVLDGFSSKWGFSSGDLLANTLGSAILIGQEFLWEEQRIVMKFSFNQGPYSYYRPQLLGNTYVENMLKDYNGQTYWASFNLASFFKFIKPIPKFLNIAFGYGAEGMTGGNANPYYVDKNGNQISFERYRQYYISLDLDLTRIKTKSGFLKGLFNAVGFIKIPAPTLEISKNGVRFNPLYF